MSGTGNGLQGLQLEAGTRCPHGLLGKASPAAEPNLHGMRKSTLHAAAGAVESPATEAAAAVTPRQEGTKKGVLTRVPECLSRALDGTEILPRSRLSGLLLRTEKAQFFAIAFVFRLSVR